MPINRGMAGTRGEKSTTGGNGEANGLVFRWWEEVGVRVGKITKERPVDRAVVAGGNKAKRSILELTIATIGVIASGTSKGGGIHESEVGNG